jgi:hypothetical protein
MSGKFSSVTGSDVRRAAAIIGRAAFLLPGTLCTPETVFFPVISNLPMGVYYIMQTNNMPMKQATR